jgi:kynurenine formamidase
LDRFTGPLALIDARGYGPGTAIGPEAVPGVLPGGAVVVIVTGWSAQWGSDAYLRHPYLGRDAAEILVAADIRTVAIDALSVDDTPAPGEPGEEPGLPAHRVLCGAGAVIAENLTGAERLLVARDAGRTAEMFLFPIPIAGADGAPARVVARLHP